MPTSGQVGYVPFLKNAQTCITITKHSLYRFWSLSNTQLSLVVIFSKFKMAASQPCWIMSDVQKWPNLNRIKQTNSFWSFLEYYHILPFPLKGFIFNQLITVGHLENDKITGTDSSGKQSCCNKGFFILISLKKSPKFTPRSYFWNSNGCRQPYL